MASSVYIETTIISYLTAKPSRDLMDYVLSWNCKHIASGRVQKMLHETNARLGVYTPIVCTPEELMEV